MRAQFVPRTDVVKVGAPALAKRIPQFTVQALGGDAIARTHEARDRNISREALYRALSGSSTTDRSEAVAALTGINDQSTPGDIVRRLEVFVLGVVEPAPDLELAIRIKDHFGTDFYAVTNRILTLSGEGADEKK